MQMPYSIERIDNFTNFNPNNRSPANRPFAATVLGSRDLPTHKFNIWPFVNTRNEKSRKKYVELPSLRYVALEYKIWWQLKLPVTAKGLFLPTIPHKAGRKLKGEVCLWSAVGTCLKG